MLVPLSKKTSSRFLFFLFVLHSLIQFIANLSVNSLQILVRSYLSSELRWQVFSLWWTRSHRFLVLGLTGIILCNRSIPLGATDFTTGKTFCHLFLHYFWSSSTLWILSSTSITFTLVLSAVTQGPNPFTTNSRRPFLEIDVKGGERDHIKAYHLEKSHQRGIVSPPQGEKEISRGREYSSRKYFSRIPDAWCSRGEMPHVFLRGRHVHMCLFALVCISSIHLYLSALIFCSLSSPSILC